MKGTTTAGRHSRQDERRRILLVEDDANDVQLIRLALNRSAAPTSLDVCRDGRHAIKFLASDACQKSPPDVIVSDIKMPVMNGLELLNWLKTESDHRRTPVVMLTSSAADRDVARAFDLGAAAYLVKSNSFVVIEDQVRALAEFWSFNQRAPRVSEHPPQADLDL